MKFSIDGLDCNGSENNDVQYTRFNDNLSDTTLHHIAFDNKHSIPENLNHVFDTLVSRRLALGKYINEPVMSPKPLMSRFVL